MAIDFASLTKIEPLKGLIARTPDGKMGVAPLAASGVQYADGKDAETKHNDLATLVSQLQATLNTFLNGILIGFGGVAVNVLGIYFKVQSFVFMPVFGLNQGVMPIMGYNYGARSKERLLKAYKLALTAAFGILGTGLLIFQLFPHVLLMPFNPTQELYDLGVPAMRTLSLCFLPAAFGIMSSTLFQATGHGTMSLAMSILRQLIGVLPVAFLFAKTLGLAAVWYAFPIAECLAIPFCIIMLRRLWVREIRDMQPHA